MMSLRNIKISQTVKKKEVLIVLPFLGDHSKHLTKRDRLITELGFRVGFRVGFSSWIFELDFRVGFSSWIFVLGFSS